MLRNMWIGSSVILLLINFRINEIETFECGTTNFIEPKVLNGEVSDRGAWPFLAALFLVENSQFFCGSTLISAKHVLTAAHCVHGKSGRKLEPEELSVLLGAYNIDVRIERGVQQRDVERIYPHEDWDTYSDKYDGDLAILLLSEIVEFTNYIRPVCMPEYDPPVDTLGWIVGWGSSQSDTVYGRHESVPLQANIQILNDSYCYTTYHFLAARSSPRAFCSGGRKATPGKGDSGGGLFVFSDSSWTQYGVISVVSSDSSGHILSDVFSLYTNLKSFRDWIDETVAKEGVNVMTAAEKRKVEIDLSCTYERTCPGSYRCSVWGVNVTSDDFMIGSVIGTNGTGHNSQNVNVIWFRGDNLEYIPYGIGGKFTALELFLVGSIDKNLGLKRLQRSNFEDMERLHHLDVVNNNIEMIDEDTFRDLPNLRTFLMNSNKLKKLRKNTFDKNTKLQYFYADSNQIEYLHQDLFQNNELLETIALRNNNLKLIYVDFTRLTSIRGLDLHGNVCIDKCLNDFNNRTTELQSLINRQCGRISFHKGSAFRV